MVFVQLLSHYVILVNLCLFSQANFTMILLVYLNCRKIRKPAVYYVVFCTLGCVRVFDKLEFSFYVFSSANVSQRQVT